MSISAQTQLPDGRVFGNKAAGEKRIALVIGNSDYKGSENDLRNPVNDARDVAARLGTLGFEVVLGTDLTKLEMRQKMRDFADKLKEQKAIGLFYYAGHGISIAGQNYLIPVDADPYSEDEVDKDADSLGFLMDKMRASENPLNIIILDACRNNPFSGRWKKLRDLNTDGGLSAAPLPQGTLIFYSAQPEKVASDGNPGSRNSPFTTAFLRHISTPNISFDNFTLRVANDVSEMTNRTQLPWKEGMDLTGFTFAGRGQESQNNSNQAAQAVLNFIPFVPIPEKNIKKAEQISQLGEELRNKDDFKLAIVNFTEAIKFNPDSDYAYTRRGECYRMLGQYKEAIDDLNEAIRRNPKNGFAYASRAVSLWGLGQTDSVMRDLDEAIRLKPDYDFAYFMRGDFQQKHGDCSKAVEDLTKAVSLYSLKDQQVYLSRSSAYLCQNDLEKALSDLNIVLRLNPNSIEALEQRLRISMQKREFDNFLQDSQKLIQLNPRESERYYVIRANLFAQQRLFNAAIQEITNVINQNGEARAIAYALRGLFYVGSENNSQALADFNQALKLSRESHEYILVYCYRALYYSETEDFKKSLADLELAFKINIEDKEIEPVLKSLLYFIRAIVQASRKKYEMASADINTAIKLYSDNSFYYLTRAEIYKKLGKFREAAEDERKMQELNQQPAFIWK